jgi:hypothetical protein
MEDPYRPPCEGRATDGDLTAIWSGRIRGMAMFVSVTTMLAGAFALWMADRYSIVIRRFRHDPPGFLPEWLWYVWNNLSVMPLWLGLFASSVASAFLHLEKRKVALVLSLAGAVIVFGWSAILVLGVRTL